MTWQLKVVLIRMRRESLMWLAYFLICYPLASQLQDGLSGYYMNIGSFYDFGSLLHIQFHQT